MDRWWLSKLPDHLPLIVGSAVVFQLGTLLFSYLFSTTRKLPNDKEDKDPVFRRMQWGVNSVSLLHALIVSWMAIGVQQDPKLRADPLFGYSRTAGDLFAISCG
jgi:hypothetical protein